MLNVLKIIGKILLVVFEVFVCVALSVTLIVWLGWAKGLLVIVVLAACMALITFAGISMAKELDREMEEKYKFKKPDNQ